VLKPAKKPTAAKPGRSATIAETPLHFSAAEFRRLLNAWYRLHARRLPWRGVDDPFATWLSEVMLQQTRVATVIDRYREFMRRFPTLKALAGAQESEVLGLWSGLGYYRRARMLLRGAQFVEHDLGGKMPQTAEELRSLPGVGAYTAAAIASIAFGECIAVVDGNVERVLLRLLGLAEKRTSAGRSQLTSIAQALMPRARRDSKKQGGKNPQGDHNQAMMELGATICLPRKPLCLQCPEFALCRTRGEHATPPRTQQRSKTAAHLLMSRRRGSTTEVLLERRAQHASQMPGMLELPVLPLEAVVGKEPVLRVRHSITTTNFSVQIYEESAAGMARQLVKQLPAAKEQLEWAQLTKLNELPLTGLARKVLQRLRMMPKRNAI